MSGDRREWDLYSISLAIVPEGTLEATATRALQAYAEALSCRHAAVFRGEETLYTIATHSQSNDEAELSTLQAVAFDILNESDSSFPHTGRTADGLAYAVFDLPGFGALVLARAESFDEALLDALGPLNEKFATVCRERLTTDGQKQQSGRKQTIEQFSTEIERILAADDTKEICQLAIAATDEITDSPNASIHLYDRATERLVPIAETVTAIDPFGDLPAGYEDRETVVWEAYQSGELVVIDDTSSFVGQLPRGPNAGESMIILPLGEHGVLCISAAEQAAFDDATLSILRLFSRLVEVALDRSERIERLQGVQEITRSAVTGESHTEIAQNILDQVPERLDFPLSTIWEYDATAQALVPIASTKKAAELFDEQPRFSSDDSLAWRAFQDGETHTITDLDRRSDVHNEQSPIGSEIIVPIGDFGIIVTGSTHPESFSTAETRLVETLAANIEAAMRLADRRQELALLDQVLARILRHNIRNDLNLIQGYASQLLDSDDEESVRLAEQIIDRCRDLEMTAEYAREMQEIVRSRDDRSHIGLASMIEEAVDVSQSEYPRATIAAHVEGDPTVVAHPALLRAVRHLIRNGIEHNDQRDEQATVELRLGWESKTPVIEIEDNGPGIPESEITVLDRHGESALEHGSGAGLWLVDRVIDYSGGTLDFETSDEGTTVRMTFDS